MSLAGGSDGTVEGGQQEILAYGQALVAFGELGVDQIDQAQLGGLVVESGDGAKLQDFGGVRQERGLGVVEGLEDAVEGAEVGGFDDGGSAIDALAVADVVIGVALDELSGEAWHAIS